MIQGLLQNSIRTTCLALLCMTGSNTSVADQQVTLTPVKCTSVAGERQHCAANTSAGILMRKSIGTEACLLGKTWGYDDAGVWVMDGCGGEFLVTQPTPMAPASGTTAAAQKQAVEPSAVPAPTTASTASKVPGPSGKQAAAAEDSTSTAPASADQATTTATGAEHNETWGTLDPGKGFKVGETPLGSLAISGYALARYMNQMSDSDSYTDHLGREHPFDGRNDIYSHRVLVWLNGWLAG